MSAASFWHGHSLSPPETFLSGWETETVMSLQEATQPPDCLIAAKKVIPVYSLI